jgi:hypothetical protein
MRERFEPHCSLPPFFDELWSHCPHLVFSLWLALSLRHHHAEYSRFVEAEDETVNRPRQAPRSFLPPTLLTTCNLSCETKFGFTVSRFPHVYIPANS